MRPRLVFWKNSSDDQLAWRDRADSADGDAARGDTPVEPLEGGRLPPASNRLGMYRSLGSVTGAADAAGSATVVVVVKPWPAPLANAGCAVAATTTVRRVVSTTDDDGLDTGDVDTPASLASKRLEESRRLDSAFTAGAASWIATAVDDGGGDAVAGAAAGLSLSLDSDCRRLEDVDVPGPAAVLDGAGTAAVVALAALASLAARAAAVPVGSNQMGTAVCERRAEDSAAVAVPVLSPLD